MTPNVDELATAVGQLQRERDVRSGSAEIASPVEYAQAVAHAQAHKWLLRRERANRGAQAREKALRKSESERLKVMDRLAKIERERHAALERHDAQRHDLTAHFDSLAHKLEAALSALQVEADAAGRAAEDAVQDAEMPRPSGDLLAPDRSEDIAALEPHQSAQRIASKMGWL